MNKERMEKLVSTISELPEQFKMEGWGFLDMVSFHAKGDAPCGIIGCYAGLTITLFHENAMTLLQYWAETHGGVAPIVEGVIRINIAKVAKELLELTDEQADSFFYVDRWPEDLLGKYLNMSSKEERTKLGIERARRLIDMGV